MEQGWVYLSTQGAFELATAPWMTGQCWRVFACLVGEMRRDGAWTATVNEAAEALGILPTNVSRALGILRAHGVVTQGKHRRYYLGGRYVWKEDRSRRAARAGQEAGRRPGEAPHPGHRGAPGPGAPE